MITTKDLFTAFLLGVDYGQYLQECERNNEDLFNGFLGFVYSQKMTMPMQEAQRRQPHSEKWMAVKGAGIKKLMDLIIEKL